MQQKRMKINTNTYKCIMLSIWKGFNEMATLIQYNQQSNSTRNINLQCLYMFSLLLLVVKNIHRFVINNEIHTINTQQGITLHIPSVNLTKCKKGAYRNF
jgi:hypothetical protein